jgi:hypothetical protein
VRTGVWVLMMIMIIMMMIMMMIIMTVCTRCFSRGHGGWEGVRRGVRVRLLLWDTASEHRPSDPAYKRAMGCYYALKKSKTTCPGTGF